MENKKDKPVIKTSNSGYTVTYTKEVFAQNLDKIASVFRQTSTKSQDKDQVSDSADRKK